MVSSYPTSTSIPRVDGLATRHPGFGVSQEVHFNLNHSLKQPELINADYEIVETKIPSSELINDCNF